jgi:hypothetical protein
MKLRGESLWRYAIPSLAVAVPLVRSIAFGSATSMVHPLVPECTDVHIVCPGGGPCPNGHCHGLVVDDHDGAICDTFCGGDCDGHCF